MPFAVVQANLDPVPSEHLRAAFEHVATLTRQDADVLAKDAFGILAEKLPFDDAAAIHRELAARGVDTEVVDHAFEEETLWLLWQQSRPRRGQDPSEDT